MKHFLRKLLNSDEKPFVAVLALAAAGSALGFSSNETSSKASILVSVPEPLKDSLTLHWTYMKDRLLRPAFLSADQSQLCIFPLSFARIGLAPPGNVKKEGSEEDGDGEKSKCCNCFGRDTIANAAATVGPAVVNISVSRGFHGLSAGRSIGSGTIIDGDGTILTCAHVVDFQGLSTSSKGKVDVTLQDGRVFEGTVLNADLHSDIAIVKIKSGTPLPAAKLGTSNKLRPGDWVVAMGCPLSLQNTITAGIVSCVDRKSSDLGLGGMRREYLQTDCAINAQEALLRIAALVISPQQLIRFSIFLDVGDFIDRIKNTLCVVSVEARHCYKEKNNQFWMINLLPFWFTEDQRIIGI